MAAVAVTSILFAPPAAIAHEEPGAQVVALTKRIEADPDDPALYLHRADLHRSRRDWQAGLADLQTAKRLDPKLDVVDFALARLLHEAGNPGLALEAADRFLAARPGHADAHLLRARVLAVLGRSPEAIAAFTRGIDLARERPGKAAQPDDYLQRARLVACNEPRDVDEALRGLDEGAATLGGAVSLQLEAIDLELARSNWNRAAERLSAVETRANRKEAWIATRAEVLALAGRLDEADRAWASALAEIDALPARIRTTADVQALAARVRERRANPALVTPELVLEGRATCPTGPT